MCGITGFIDYRKKSDEDILDKMTSAIPHRGPDDWGKVLFNESAYQLGFGHRRLSILDLSPLGHQPYYNESRDLVIVYNGEIYNFLEIRAELEKEGFVFRSHSDTEVLINAFKRWGKDAVQKFVGMFAFALYDIVQHKLILCRDRSGVKPLYYYQHNGVLLFASELKSMHQHPAFEKKIAAASFAMYMQYGYIPAPHSIFEHTYKLEPGHMLEIDLETQRTEKIKYWDVIDHYNADKLKLSEQEALEETEKLLKSAFEYRMVSDVPVGVFLSGGYDSSAVTALLQTNRTEKLRTFTIGFHEKGFNEAPHAKKVAEHLGTDHTEYYCTQQDALEIIPQLPYLFDEPFGDSSAIPTLLVSKLARQHVTVALSADAGDEVFGGYSKYLDALKYYNFFTKFPTPAGQLLGKVLSGIPADYIPFTGKITNFSSRYAKIGAFLEQNSPVRAMQYLSQFLTKKEINQFVKGRLSLPHTNFDSESLLNNQLEPLDSMLAIDYKTYMVDDILVKVDRATMAVSLEGREPLLDHRIIEFVAKLPADLKIKGTNKKHLLKHITHKYIPESIMNRPKMGFGVPIMHWFKDELRVYFANYLTRERSLKHNLYNFGVVEKWLKEYAAGENVELNTSRLWFILMFEMWYEKWM